MKISKILTGVVVLIIGLCTSSLSYSQIKWLHSFDVAKKIAKQENKLIIVDCWATWCGPCARMDDDVWENENMDEYANKYVFVKLDVSSGFSNPDFSIDAVPKIFVVDAWKHEYKNLTGYQSMNQMRLILDGFNFDYKEIYDAEKIAREDENNPTKLLQLAMCYQKAYNEIEAKTRFLLKTQSNQCFKKAEKKIGKNKKSELFQEKVLLSCMNKNPKKRLKEIQSLKTMNDNLESIKNAVLTKTYIELGDKDKAAELFAKIKNYELPYYDFLKKERLEFQ